MKKESTLKKELTLNEIKVLCCISDDPMFGKQIVVELKNNEITLKLGAVYNCLYKLEEKKYIKSIERTEKQLSYQITKEGKDALDKEFWPLVKIINKS